VRLDDIMNNSCVLYNALRWGCIVWNYVLKYVLVVRTAYIIMEVFSI
jgi:hypothetical protein